MQINKLLNLVLTLTPGTLGDKIAAEVKSGLSPLIPYLRRVAFGLMLIIASGLSWLFAILSLVVALFLYLSDLSQYIGPALITGLIFTCIAALMLLLGLRLARKPL